MQLADANRVLDAIHPAFSGQVIVLGPMPRLLRDCCGTKSHHLRDERGKRVDMLQYVDSFSSLSKRGLDLPENSTFVGYKEVFAGRKFNVSMLKDQIHPKTDTINRVAAYCMTWLDRDEDDLGGHDAEDPLPGFSEVLTSSRLPPPPPTWRMSPARIAVMRRK